MEGLQGISQVKAMQIQAVKAMHPMINLSMMQDDYQALTIITLKTPGTNIKTHLVNRDYVHKVNEDEDIQENIVLFKPITSNQIVVPGTQDDNMFTRCIYYHIHSDPYIQLPTVFRTVWRKQAIANGLHTYELIAFKATPDL